VLTMDQYIIGWIVAAALAVMLLMAGGPRLW
jgi:hypothetical protein